MFRKLFKLILFTFHAKSTGGYGIHSPFIYDLVTRVISYKENKDSGWLLSFRKEIENDKTTISMSDYGAGASGKVNKPISVGKLARLTGIPHRFGILLYNLVSGFKPACIIEVGTGLGISTAYLAKAGSDSSIFTIEGSKERASYANVTFRKLGLRNVIIKVGEFDTLLPDIVQSAKHPLLVFVDGNHRYGATIKYFQTILKHAKDDTIIIFDDIYWSAEMEEAWKEISGNDRVVLSMDFYRLGVVFFREGMVKQHISVNYFT